MRVVGEVKAGVRGRGVAAGIDLERSDLPIGRDRAYQEEESDERGEEEQEAAAAAPALLFRGIRRQAGDTHLRSTLARSNYGASFA